MLVNGIDQPRSVGFDIESERWCVDDVQVEIFDVETTVLADTKDTFADHGCGVLGEVDESRSFMLESIQDKAFPKRR